MSVTISIENNVPFIDENSPELVTVRTYEDPCSPDGTASFKDYPFEVNLANGNFFALWQAIGLEADYCGAIEADVLLAALSRFDVNSLVSETVVDGRMVCCGRTIEQVSRYFWNVSLIAHEAKSRGELVTWG